MARVFIDGFESKSLDLWDAYSGWSFETSNPIDGASHIKSNSANAIKNLPVALSEVWVALRYKTESVGYGSLNFFEFRNGSTVVGTIQLNYNVFRVLRGSSTVLATGTTIIVANQTLLLEARFKPADSGGVFQFKVNGVLDIDFSGDTTDGPTTIDNIRIVSPNGNVFMNFDNIVVDDAEFPGNTKIRALRPNGAGNSTQWTPSGGNNWDCVDEVPASDSDYVATNTLDVVDLYSASDLPAEAYSVKCVQVQARAYKEGTPDVQNLQLACRTHDTNYFSSNKALTTSAKSHAQIWQTNPNTAEPWTISEVNAMEIGVKALA